MEITHCGALPFVGRGYNRILLPFSSRLCGQMHLNVSAVSCLFRAAFKIGKHECRPSSHYLSPRFVFVAPIVYARLLWITLKRRWGLGGEIGAYL